VQNNKRSKVYGCYRRTVHRCCGNTVQGAAPTLLLPFGNIDAEACKTESGCAAQAELTKRYHWQ
jgi:hypothetical protein